MDVAAKAAKTCPSAPPEPGALLFGVVTAPGQVAYISPAIPATQELIDTLAREDIPIENRARFATTCAEGRCVQWAGGRCGLADRAIEALSIAKGREDLPRCAIRATCRWYSQHRAKACAACPEVIRRPAEATAEG